MSDPLKPAGDAASERAGRDLKQVNEKLREVMASLRSDRARLAPEARAAAVPVPAPAPAPARTPAPAADAVDLEKKRLAAELALAREAASHAAEERDRLRARVAELEAEAHRLSDDYVGVQEKGTELAQLYVALERIHGGLTRAETLAALQEIVINVVGSEELAILERRGDRLVLAQSFGIDPAPWRELPLDAGAIGRAAAGALYVAGRAGRPAPGEEDLTACIPLRAGDQVVGVLAVFRLLGHKPVLGDGDDALFELLSRHGGLALHLRSAREAAGA